MTLSQHYHATQTLSPKAARLAARLLDRSMNIPFEWRLSLRMALVERGRASGPFTTSDLAPLTAGQDKADDPAANAEAGPQDQALRFIQAIQGDPASNDAG